MQAECTMNISTEVFRFARETETISAAFPVHFTLPRVKVLLRAGVWFQDGNEAYQHGRNSITAWVGI
jgi:hypothetical protein